MRQYERSGVHVDQCTECRGIFLDRGELERLIDAETAFHTQPAPAPAPSGHGYDSRSHGYPKKRKSFLEDLFD
jgi:Zn-finger nucleic acid-binding protein